MHLARVCTLLYPTRVYCILQGCTVSYKGVLYLARVVTARIAGFTPPSFNELAVHAAVAACVAIFARLNDLVTADRVRIPPLPFAGTTGDDVGKTICTPCDSPPLGKFCGQFLWASIVGKYCGQVLWASFVSFVFIN
jgi:hypothetical protein